eukprot:jgi/Chlat1/5829/Chrsp4S06363
MGLTDSEIMAMATALRFQFATEAHDAQLVNLEEIKEQLDKCLRLLANCPAATSSSSAASSTFAPIMSPPSSSSEEPATSWERVRMAARGVQDVVEAQDLWLRSGRLFGSRAARSLLPMEDRQYKARRIVHVEFLKLLAFLHREAQVLASMASASFSSVLPLAPLRDLLAPRALATRLERARSAAPRLAAAAADDKELINILTVNTIAELESHLSRVCPSVSTLILDPSPTTTTTTAISSSSSSYTNLSIVGVCSRHGEELLFGSPVVVSDSIQTAPDEWIGRLTREINGTFKAKTRECLGSVLSTPQDEWVTSFPLQSIALVHEIVWTDAVASAFEARRKGHRRALRDLLESTTRTLAAFGKKRARDVGDTQGVLVYGQLAALTAAHQLVVEELVEKNVGRTDEYDWASKMQCMWEPDIDGCMVSALDARVEYGWEYTGGEVRGLHPVSPVTLHAVLSCVASGRMCAGVDIETVREVAAACGRWVLSLPSSSSSALSLAMRVAGAAACAAWVVLEGVSESVPSGVVNHLRAAYEAMAAGKDRYRSRGDQMAPLTVLPGFACFIADVDSHNNNSNAQTHIHRTVQWLGRRVALPALDMQVALELRLASVGLPQAHDAARKCSESKAVAPAGCA